ncbi:MAG: hypothetical protein RL728_77 [Bacteroidota bacterium]|jgi:hypothetical protein
MMSDIGTTKKTFGSKTNENQKVLQKIIFDAWFRYCREQNESPWSEKRWNVFFENIGVSYTPQDKEPVQILSDKTFKSARVKFNF